MSCKIAGYILSVNLWPNISKGNKMLKAYINSRGKEWGRGVVQNAQLCLPKRLASAPFFDLLSLQVRKVDHKTVSKTRKRFPLSHQTILRRKTFQKHSYQNCENSWWQCPRVGPWYSASSQVGQYKHGVTCGAIGWPDGWLAYIKREGTFWPYYRN